LGVRASQAYANKRVRAEIDSYAAQLATTKDGTTARENVEKQHVLNLKAIKGDTNNVQIQLAAAKYEKIADIARQSISALSTMQDAQRKTSLTAFRWG
jgi:ABC-type molybdate transport system ATPase subunit